MTYYFNLEWDELSKDLREEKIDQYLRAQYELESGAEIIEAAFVANTANRTRAEYAITARFPIYF